MSAPRRDYEIDPQAVRAAARARLLLRVTVAGALLALYGLAVDAWAGDAHRRLAWSFALTLAAVYAAVEVSALGWSRRGAPTMVLRLGTQGLELWIGTGRHVIPWNELQVRRIRMRRNRVRAIELHGRDSGPVRLAGFQHMDELAQALTALIAARRADT